MRESVEAPREPVERTPPSSWVEPAADEGTLKRAFVDVERAVEVGNADLRALGFWELVGRAKRDPMRAGVLAEMIGRIDRREFEARARPRFPVWLGTLALSAGLLASAALVVLSAWLVYRDPPLPTLAGVLLVAAAVGLSVTAHDLGHWLGGRLVGIRFLGYFLDGPFRIQPGLKTDYASYLRATAGQRAWMHASGALASKLAPFAVFAAAYVPHALNDWSLYPPWSLWAVLVVGAIQVLTDVLWSRKRSDWKKVARECRAARDLAARQ
ncbi:MAG TPA: hypothetical protein VEO00_03690 [Actinomycetota bacterium]|nr:hypothetical protein [Actinomycetota bacterium]